jgi:hypothetical protein
LIKSRISDASVTRPDAQSERLDEALALLKANLSG